MTSKRSRHKSVDELKIDVDILVLEIGDLSSRKDQINVLRHLEESLEIVKRGQTYSNTELTSEGDEDIGQPRRKRLRRSSTKTQKYDDEDNEDEDMSETETSDELELNHTFHAYDVRPVSNPDELAMAKDKSLYYTVEAGVYNCILCDFNTDKENSMRIHLTRHTSNIKCEVCDVYFTRAVNLRRHQEGVQHKARMMMNNVDNDAYQVTETEPMYVCPNAPECVQTFATEHDLNCHVETHLYKCQYCNAMFTGDQDRYEHMRHDHDIGSSKRARSVTDEVGYNNVQNSPNGNRKLVSYQCSTCVRTFNTLYSLEQHMEGALHKEMVEQQLMGMDVSGEEYHCRHCGKTYSRMESFRRHLVIHTDKYKCPNCDRCFQEKSKLENHLNNNEDCSNVVKESQGDTVETFPCHLCSKTYSKREYLSQHMVEHTDKYQCTTCHLSFSNKRRLETHNRNPDNCAKLITFRENAKKKQEERVPRRKSESDAMTMRKTDNKRLDDDQPRSANSSPKAPIECSECHQPYSSLYSLRRHIDRMHPEVNETNDTNDTDTNEKEVKEEVEVKETPERQEIQVFHCEDCDKFFSSKASLTNHLIRHTDKFQCSVCKQGFSCRRFLEQHSRNKNNCDKLLMKKQKQSLVDTSILNARDFVETIIKEEEKEVGAKNNNS